MTLFRSLIFCCLAFLPTSVSAHYLWVTLKPNVGKLAISDVYFEEGPGPGDGSYLDPFVKGGKLWLRTVEQPEPKSLKLVEIQSGKFRWLQAAVKGTGPRSLESYGKFGVYRYGKTDVLLHYYARLIDVKTHEDLHELARAEHMDLDIVPHDSGDQMRLQVLWKGKPAKERIVHIRGPQKLKLNLKTSENGIVRFTMKGEGKYTFRTSVEEDQSGTDGGKDYSLIRHNATMVFQLPLEK